MDRIIDFLYESLLDNTAWDGCIKDLCSLVGADCACIIVSSTANERIYLAVLQGGNPEKAAEYAKSIHALDPFVDLGDLNPSSIDEVIHESQWESSEFYRGCVAGSGLHYFLGMDITIGDNVVARIRFGRGKSKGNFQASDKKYLKKIAPHLKRVLLIKQRMGYSEAEIVFYKNTLNRMSMGLISVDESGHIHDVNDAARFIINECEKMSIKNESLLFSNAKLNRDLNLMMQKTAEQQGNECVSIKNSMSFNSDDFGGRITITVQTKYRNFENMQFNKPQYLLSLYDHSGHIDVSTELLRNLFGLTKKESLICSCLVNNQTLDDAANSLGIKRNTAKAHLRSIFLKMGVSRQAQLISLIIRNTTCLPNIISALPPDEALIQKDWFFCVMFF